MEDVVKAYVNRDRRAYIICSGCSRARWVDAVPFLERSARARIRCTCGISFVVQFDQRKWYRKAVDIFGTYTHSGEGSPEYELHVLDLSMTGLCFEPDESDTVLVGDILQVRFAIPDSKRTRMVETVIVARVQDGIIGAAYCEVHKERKNYGFFLRE